MQFIPVKLFILLVPLLVLAFSSECLAQSHVQFPGAGGVQIKAVMYAPDQAALRQNHTPWPVVIALHGCGGLYATAGARKGLLNARHHAMGQMLSEQGYQVVFPDSFGSRGVVGVCSEVQRLSNGIQVGSRERSADVLAALAWVRAQSWADPKRVAVLGWSHGAQTLLAATDAGQANVQAAARFVTAIAFYPGCVNAARTGYQPNTPLALLLGAEDDWTLPAPCIQLAEKLQKQGHAVMLKIYPGAVHDFDTPLPGIRTRNDIPSRSPARAGQGVQVGQNPAAREDSWALVRAILRESFK